MCSANSIHRHAASFSKSVKNSNRPKPCKIAGHHEEQQIGAATGLRDRIGIPSATAPQRVSRRREPDPVQLGSGSETPSMPLSPRLENSWAGRSLAMSRPWPSRTRSWLDTGNSLRKSLMAPSTGATLAVRRSHRKSSPGWCTWRAKTPARATPASWRTGDSRPPTIRSDCGQGSAAATGSLRLPSAIRS